MFEEWVNGAPIMPRDISLSLIVEVFLHVWSSADYGIEKIKGAQLIFSALLNLLDTIVLSGWRAGSMGPP